MKLLLIPILIIPKSVQLKMWILKGSNSTPY